LIPAFIEQERLKREQRALAEAVSQAAKARRETETKQKEEADAIAKQQKAELKLKRAAEKLQEEADKIQQKELKQRGKSSKRKQEEISTKCANPLCECEYVNGDDSWIGCDHCSKWFCDKRACLAMEKAHEKTCKKPKSSK
jgi:hypothetical protein